MSLYTVTLLLGSNLGEPKLNIENALQLIANDVGTIYERSGILQSKPVEFASNNIFCNIAVLIKTGFSPIKVLKLIKQIEQNMGRTEDSSVTNTYADRVIDIDIVRFDQITFENKSLRIPHIKHVYEREFSKLLLQSLKH